MPMPTPHKPNPGETTSWADLQRILIALLQELQPTSLVKEVRLDSSLERDLGLDSLGRVELLARIERHCGLMLPEQAFALVETPRDLLREMERATTRSGVAPLLRETTASAVSAPGVPGVPSEAQTLVEVLEWHNQTSPNRPHIQLYADGGDGAVIDYRALYQGAKDVAACLQYQGLTPGEPVAIMLPTGEHYFFVFFGILLAGGIPVPIYPPTRPSQLEDHMRRHTAILRNCRAVMLITMDEAKGVARLLKAQVENIRELLSFDDLLRHKGDYVRPVISPKDTAFLQYTSGSTGSPKGVVLSHANLLANIRAMGERVQANASDVFVSWLPLYHDMGLIGAWFGSLYYGARLVIMSPLAFLARPQRWLQAIHRYGGTLSAAPNFGYELCLYRLQDSDLEGLDLSTWRAAFNGAEPVSPETTLKFPQRFARYGFRPTAMMPVYGLAECSVGLAFPPLDQTPRIDRVQRQAFAQTGEAIPADENDTSALRFVACGRVLTGHDIRIADEQGRELPERQEGHLQFRGPSTTSGYLHNPEATQRLFRGDWLDSGDLAYMSEGDLFVTGRTKDIIIRAGRNLYPHELEEAVGGIPGIRKGRVAVFGAKDERSATERLVVLAESRVSDAGQRQELRQKINDLASELMGTPADDIVLARPNTVLKTSSGKIRRSACRALYEAGFLAQAHSPLWRQVGRLLLTSILPQWRRLRRSIRSALWAGYAKAVFWTLAPLTWTAVVAIPSVPFRWWCMRQATRLLAGLTATPLHVEGRGHLPDSKQPCIFVANHASYLDGPLLIAALGQPFSFVAKIELDKQRIAGSFLRSIGTEFVERFNVSQGAEDAANLATLAQGGRSLLFFPEGTFTRSPGVLPFHLGAFLAAAESGLPIIPVAIRGTRSILRGDENTPRKGAVRITIGAPLWPASGEKAWESALALRDEARAFILQYCGEPELL